MNSEHEMTTNLRCFIVIMNMRDLLNLTTFKAVKASEVGILGLEGISTNPLIDDES